MRHVKRRGATSVYVVNCEVVRASYYQKKKIPVSLLPLSAAVIHISMIERPSGVFVILSPPSLPENQWGARAFNTSTVCAQPRDRESVCVEVCACVCVVVIFRIVLRHINTHTHTHRVKSSSVHYNIIVYNVIAMVRCVLYFMIVRGDGVSERDKRTLTRVRQRNLPIGRDRDRASRVRM